MASTLAQGDLNEAVIRKLASDDEARPGSEGGFRTRRACQRVPAWASTQAHQVADELVSVHVGDTCETRRGDPSGSHCFWGGQRSQ
jgi:hypothetical protein